jgi:hypothetical protein
MAHCSQETITDAAFAHFTDIHTLNITSCRQLTNGIFIHLSNIQKLEAGQCPALTIHTAKDVRALFIKE